MVYQLGYVSTAVGGVERRQLLQILSTARSQNAAAEITGVLLYRDGRFLQLLEGPAPAVGALFQKIAADPRHTDVKCIWTAHAADRLFEQWSMGSRDLTDDPLQHPRYVNLLADNDAARASPSTLIDLWELLRPATSWLDQQRGTLTTSTAQHASVEHGSALLGLAAALRRMLDRVR